MRYIKWVCFDETTGKEEKEMWALRVDSVPLDEPICLFGYWICFGVSVNVRCAFSFQHDGMMHWAVGGNELMVS